MTHPLTCSCDPKPRTTLYVTDGGPPRCPKCELPKCCYRCRDSHDSNGVPFCNNAACKCHVALVASEKNESASTEKCASHENCKGVRREGVSWLGCETTAREVLAACSEKKDLVEEGWEEEFDETFGKEQGVVLDLFPHVPALKSFIREKLEQARREGNYELYKQGKFEGKAEERARLAKEVIGRHNARILNEYQNLGLGDERVLWKPIETATEETLALLNVPEGEGKA